MERTSARLRKTFRYPEEEEDDDLPEGLDEEEQEIIIQKLNDQNATLNAQYTRYLLCIPLLCTLPYLTTLLTPRLGLLSLLSISSLLSTSYLLHRLPPSKTAIAFLDNLSRDPSAASASAPPTAQRPRSRRERIAGPEPGPILAYLPYLNVALCAVLMLLGAVVGRKLEGQADRGRGLWTGFSWLPACVYAVVLLAKWIMGSVDPEAELETLRYELKGA